MSVFIYSAAYSGSQYSQNETFTNPIVFKLGTPFPSSYQIQLFLRHAVLSGSGAESSSGISVQAHDISTNNESDWIQIAPDSSGSPGTYGAGGASVSLSDVPAGSIVPFWAKVTVPSGQPFGVIQNLQLVLSATQTTTYLPISLTTGTATNCNVSNGTISSGSGYGFWLSSWMNIPRTLSFPATYTKSGTDGSISYRSSTDGTVGNATSWTYDAATLDNSKNYVQIRVEFQGNSYDNVILNDGAVAYYPIGTSGGTDLTGGSTGTVNGSPSLVAGLVNDGTQAYNFASTGQYIQVPNQGKLQITAELTLEYWIKLNNFSNRYNPIHKAYSGEYTLTQETDGSISFYNGTDNGAGNTYTANSVTGMNAGVVVHVVLTRSHLTGGKVEGWFNGVKLYSVTTSGTASSSTAPLDIGQGYTGVGGLGIMHKIAVYNKVLSSTQIFNHYTIGSSSTIGNTPGTYSAINFAYAGPNKFYYDIASYDGPDTPILITPTSGTVTALFQPTFIVNVHNCDHIEFEVDISLSFNTTNLQDWTAVASTTGNTSSLPPLNLAASGLWYWRARGILNGAVGAWSDPISFTILPIPTNNQFIYLYDNLGLDFHDSIQDNRFICLYSNLGLDIHDPIVDSRFIYLNDNIGDGVGNIIYPLQDNTAPRVLALPGDTYP